MPLFAGPVTLTLQVLQGKIRNSFDLILLSSKQSTLLNLNMHIASVIILSVKSNKIAVHAWWSLFILPILQILERQKYYKHNQFPCHYSPFDVATFLLPIFIDCYLFQMNTDNNIRLFYLEWLTILLEYLNLFTLASSNESSKRRSNAPSYHHL